MATEQQPTVAPGRGRGRAEAAAAIWRWRDRGDEPARQARSARKTAAIRALVAALAGGAFFYFGRTTVASIAWSVGGLSLLLAIVSPLGAYAALDRLVEGLGVWIGRALTWLLFAPFYYVFFVPFGLLFRRGARDPMKRAIEPEADTYWQPREAARPLDRPY